VVAAKLVAKVKEDMAMPKSRVQPHQVLLDLEKSMPALIEKYPDDSDFKCAFVREANLIASDAASEDHAWIHGQIGCILDEFGMQLEGYPVLSDDGLAEVRVLK
jgi:hypothetical protein